MMRIRMLPMRAMEQNPCLPRIFSRLTRRHLPAATPATATTMSTAFSLPPHRRNYYLATPFRRQQRAATGSGGSAQAAEGLQTDNNKKRRREYSQQLQALAQEGGRLQGRALLTTLQEMERLEVMAEEKAYMELLKRCGKERALEASQRVHAHLLSFLSASRPVLCSRLSTCLISAYGNCGRVDYAREVFEQMGEHDAVAWNAMIQAFTQCGHGKEAVEVFQRMQRAGVTPNLFTYTNVLKACASAKDLETGKQVHAKLIRGGFPQDAVLSTTLIRMYSQCGRMDEARAIFQGMKNRDAYTWNSMIAEEAQSGRGKKALEVFQQMQQAGVPPDSFTYTSALKACAVAEDLEMGKHAHAQLLQRGPLSIPNSNALISMYGKCGRMEEARAVFSGMKQRDTVTWSSIITEETRHGHAKEALELFGQMEQAGVSPDPFTFTSVLKACGSIADLETGKRVHAQLLRRGLLPNVRLSTALISMYGKCGRMDKARAVFQRMKRRDVVAWNSMIAEEIQCGHAKEALLLFQQMQQARVPPDSLTYTSVLQACATTKNLELGKRVHAQFLRRGSLSLSESNALINMYGKCGRIDEAGAVFKAMKKRNVASWTAMIQACTQCGHEKEALELLQQMQQAGMQPDPPIYAIILKACGSMKDLETGKQVHAQLLHQGLLPDVMLSTALISMYGKCGRIDEARAVFTAMKERNVVTWTSMIVAEIQCGNGKEALELFQQMQQAGVSPNSFTYTSVLKACGSIADLETGKQVHAQLLHHGSLNLPESNALINMYGKCGQVGDARAVFLGMKQRNVLTWTSMVAVHGMHGQGREALAAFEEMQQQGLQPNDITFINVLNACSHTGLVEEGLACFAAMKEKHGIQPTVDHYNCVVDMLGRAGRLDEAEALIDTMVEVPPDAVTWMALLGACGRLKDVERAQRAAERAVELGAQDASPFVILSNIYAAAGREEDAKRVQNKMAECGVKSEAGRSWITVNGQMHSFLARDRSHPRSKEIYKELARLNQRIKAAGYKPDTDWTLPAASKEPKEMGLAHHSDNLAVAFGLLATPPGEPLRIITTLWLSGDSHTAAKYIAKVTQREILVRDVNRFHHFSPNLTCSCGDRW
ncbi:Chlororespiratory reduction 2 [Balamuthia mandrillaris]